MLTLRLQRTGRKKLAHYRLIAQEHRLTPTSGKVAAYLGNYNPHTKDFNFDKEKVEKYLSNGAQPSQSVAVLLKKAKVKLPAWVTIHQKPEKKTEQPKEESASEVTTPAGEPTANEATPAEEAPATEAEPEATEK